MWYYRNYIEEEHSTRRFPSKTLTFGGKKLSDFIIGKSNENSSGLPIRGWRKLTAVFSFFIKFLVTFKNLAYSRF